MAIEARGGRSDALGDDGDLLGRTIDTFVMAQLRPEISRLGRRARVHHLRTKAVREEIDIVIELPGGKLIGLEIIELGNRIHALPISSFWG